MLETGLESILAEVPHPHAAPVRDSAHARVPLLAFVADDETEAALRGGFLNTVEGIEIRRGTILHAIKHLTKEPTPRALVVDILGVPNPMDELDNLAGVCTPDVKVLVIGEEVNVSVYRELIHTMGVAEYMHKPVTRENVTRLFVPQIAGVTMDAGASRGGSVIAVCGVRGGAGTTTIAVNLALQLSAATRGHVALLDLHLRLGTAALMLGLNALGGLRIALEQPERADALFLDRVCVEINERLRLIAADEPLDATPMPTPDGVRRVLDLLRKRFNYVVIDLPVPATLAEMQALRAARHLLVVMAPDLAGIRDADRLRKLANALGTSHTSIVLNRVGMQGGMTVPMIEEGLGNKPTIQIPDLGRQLSRAANLGAPAIGSCAAFRKAMALLAQEVSGAAAGRMSGSDSRSLLGWILGR
jgi:pilus assembly protein CpaE